MNEAARACGVEGPIGRERDMRGLNNSSRKKS